MSIAFLSWAVIGFATGLVTYGAFLLVQVIGAAVAAVALRSVRIVRPRLLAFGLILTGLFDLIGFASNASGLPAIAVAAELVEAVASVWFIVFSIRCWNAEGALEIGQLRWPLSLMGLTALYWGSQWTEVDTPYVPGNVLVVAAVVLYWFAPRNSDTPRAVP